MTTPSPELKKAQIYAPLEKVFRDRNYIDVAYEELRALIAQREAKVREELREKVMALRVTFPNKCFTHTHKSEPCSCYDREKGYTQALKDILSLLSLPETNK